MKEAITSPYNRIVFRETFTDESSVRKNGGTPTGVVFSEGRGLFSSTTSARVNYDLRLENRPTAFRFRVNINSFGSNKVLLDLRSSAVSGILIYIDDTGVVQASGATVYVNGVVGNQLALNTDNEIIFVYSNVTQGTGTNHFVVGANYVNGSNTTGFIDLFEIYVGSLTLSQVQGLYKNTWNKEFISSNLLLDYDSTNGYITDRTGNNTLTPTNVTIKKTGIYYGSEFNGVDSTLITDSTDPTIWQSGFTVVAWIKPRGWGELAYGRILDVSNSAAGKDGFNFCINNLNSSLFCNINEGGATRSGINSINIGSWQFVVLTVSSNSYINFYKGDIDVAPTQSGAANRTSGLITSITTTNPVTIGNRSTATDSTFNGNIPMLKVYKGVLSLEQLTQIWSSTRGKIE